MAFINLEKLKAGNRAYIAKLESAMAEAARTSGQLALIHLRANPPFKSRSGKLLAATDFTVRSSSSGALLKFEAKVPYASYLERGTPPHRIPGAPVLRFYWEKAGETAHLRFVNHPGTKATHFLETTRDLAASFFSAELNKRL